MSNPEQFHFYVSCPPGLEPSLAKEYHVLNFKRVKTKPSAEDKNSFNATEDPGGMEFEGPLESIFQANLHLRTASRVTVRLGDFIAITFAELRKKTSKLEWGKFLKPGQKVNVQAVCHKSRLYHSDAVAERVLGGINDHFSSTGLPMDFSAEGQLVLVRMVDDRCTISLDSSGELLHRRGYRQAVAKAPLRENLAAGLLISSGWDQTSPLIDPFCGSGTFPIEAALLARHIAPGINRGFRFMEWNRFDQSLWSSLLENAKKQILPGCPTLLGFDRDQGAIEMAKANAARAGQFETVRFGCQAVSYLEPLAENGWILTNPPYGVRIGEDKDLRDLYARFGSLLQQKFSGWRVCLLSGDDRLTANLGLGIPQKSIGLSNGGLPIKMVVFSL